MALAKQHRLRTGRFSEAGRTYLVTITCHNRKPVFSSFHAGCCFGRAIGELKNDAETWCWVAMPDHAHWLMAPGSEKDLSSCVQKLKSLTTRSLRKCASADHPVWQRGFHDRALRREDELKPMARYVIANPIRAELVKSVRDWPFWDAAWI